MIARLPKLDFDGQAFKVGHLNSKNKAPAAIAGAVFLN